MENTPSLDGIVDAKPEASLSDVQLLALEVLCEKRSVTAAAEVAGVNRKTIQRWLKTNPHFRAKYNSWLQDIADSAHEHLVSVYDEAAGQVAESIRTKKDIASARMVVRHLGFPRQIASRPCTPDAVAREMELDRREEELRLKERAEGLNDMETSHFIRQHNRGRQKWIIQMQQAVNSQTSQNSA
jgi:hypothetical protein